MTSPYPEKYNKNNCSKTLSVPTIEATQVLSPLDAGGGFARRRHYCSVFLVLCLLPLYYLSRSQSAVHRSSMVSVPVCPFVVTYSLLLSVITPSSSHRVVALPCASVRTGSTHLSVTVAAAPSTMAQSQQTQSISFKLSYHRQSPSLPYRRSPLLCLSLRFSHLLATQPAPRRHCNPPSPPPIQS